MSTIMKEVRHGKMENNSKKSKKKKAHALEDGRDNKVDGGCNEAVDKNADASLQMETSRKQKKMKRKSELSEEETYFTNAAPTEVKMGSNLSKEDKKKRKKKKHELGVIQDEARHVEGNLEVNGGLQREKKHRNEDSAEANDACSEKTQIGEKCLQTNDESDGKKKKKRHEKQKKLVGDSTVSSSLGILEGEKTRIDKVVESKKSSDKEISEMNNGKEGAKRGEHEEDKDDERKKKTDDREGVAKSGEDHKGGNIEKIKKRKRNGEKKKDNIDLDAGLQEFVIEESGKEGSILRDGESNAQSTPSKAQNGEDKKDGKDKKRKKTKSVENGSENPKKSKRVSFSGHVEVFPLSDTDTEKKISQKDDLVRGKRFSREEDEIVKEAVLKYIEEHDLGEEGVDMVMHCAAHPKIRNCWKEIGAVIPYRPPSAIYYRAHILFERAEKRAWTKEEFEFLRKSQQKHGNNWKMVADELGKHRFHVKDTWRRIKLSNEKKGHWTQEEYQNLYDLVNMDLQMKADSNEKKSKHGMLRDNIPWTAISDKLSTRAVATCCSKWYEQLTSSMVAEGVWSDSDDYRLLGALYDLDASCVEDVDWDNLLEHRTGDLCRKRWDQMVLHIGYHGCKPFAEQVETLAQRYCPDLAETRESWDSKPVIP